MVDDSQTSVELEEREERRARSAIVLMIVLTLLRSKGTIVELVDLGTVWHRGTLCTDSTQKKSCGTVRSRPFLGYMGLPRIVHTYSH